MLFITELKNNKLTVKRLLNISFYLYTKNFIPLMIIVMIICTPIQLVLSIVSQYLSQNEAVGSIVSNPFSLDMMKSPEIYGQLLYYYAIIVGMQVVFAPIGVAAVAIAVKKAVYGKEIVYQDIIVKAFSQFPTLLLASVLQMICIMVGSLLILPAIFLYVALHFYIYSIAICHTKGTGALVHSYKIVTKNWFRIFLLMIWFGFFEIGLSSMMMTILFFLPDFVGRILLTVVDCFFYVLNAVWFMNLVFYEKKEEPTENPSSSD